MSGPSEFRARGGLKWTYHPEDTMAAWVAEMDFGLAPPIAEALHEAIDRGVTGYPYPDAESATAGAAASFFGRRFGWEPSPEWIFAAPDVIEAGRRAIHHLTPPGSAVIVHSPVYFPFYGMIDGAQRDVIEVICSRDEGGTYRLNLDAIERSMDDGAGAIVLCNPWNPTGRSLSRTELEDLFELARAHRVRVIADEVHAPILYDGHEHIPAATIDPELTITITSASKAWNLPGLKCAQVILTNERDRDIWAAYFTPDRVGVGTLGLIANTAAYTRGEPWLTDVMDRLTENRDLLGRLLAEQLPRIRWTPPEGTYLAWLDLSAYQLTNPTAHLLDEARVALTGGAPFGTGAEQFGRLNFATTPQILTEIVDRMAGALTRQD